MTALPVTARRGLFGLVAGTALTTMAPIGASTAETPLAALNRRLQNIYEEWAALDDATTAAIGTHQRNALQAAQDEKLDEMLAPRFEAANHQAETLEDAVIQATLSYYLLESITVDPRNEADLRAAHTMIASIVLCLAKLGHIDLKRIAQGEMAEIAPIWAPGGRRWRAA